MKDESKETTNDEGKQPAERGTPKHQQGHVPMRERLGSYMVNFAEVFGIPVGAFLYVWQNRGEPLTIIVTGIAVVGFVHGISRVLNFKRRKLTVGVTLALSVVGCVSWYFSINPKRAGEPQLQLVLESPRFPLISLPLTNAGLFREYRQEYRLLSNLWMLVVPVASSQSDATLRIRVQNMSKTESVEGFELQVTISDDLQIARGTLAEGSGWVLSSTTTPNAQSLEARIDKKMRP